MKINSQYNFNSKPDETFNSSTQNSLSDIDFDVNTSLDIEASWKQLCQIVMSHFDVPKVTDGVTGYKRSAWMVESFPNGTGTEKNNRSSNRIKTCHL